MKLERKETNRKPSRILKGLYEDVIDAQYSEGKTLNDSDFLCWAKNHNQSLSELNKSAILPSAELMSAFEQEFIDREQLPEAIRLLYCERQLLGLEEELYVCEVDMEVELEEKNGKPEDERMLMGFS